MRVELESICWYLALFIFAGMMVLVTFAVLV